MKTLRWIFFAVVALGAMIGCTKKEETPELATPVAGKYQMTEYYKKDYNMPASTNNTSANTSATITVTRIDKETITVSHTIPTATGTQTLDFDSMKMDSGNTFKKSYTNATISGSFSNNNITYTLTYTNGDEVRVKGTRI